MLKTDTRPPRADYASHTAQDLTSPAIAAQNSSSSAWMLAAAALGLGALGIAFLMPETTMTPAKRRTYLEEQLSFLNIKVLPYGSGSEHMIMSNTTDMIRSNTTGWLWLDPNNEWNREIPKDPEGYIDYAMRSDQTMNLGLSIRKLGMSDEQKALLKEYLLMLFEEHNAKREK